MPAGICERCGVQRAWLHRHHVKPRCYGGTDADGIALLCANCHEDAHEGPMGGKTHVKRWAPETNTKRAEAMREQWRDPAYRERMKARRSRRRTVDDQQVRTLRESGMTTAQIAQQMGCSLGTVWNALKRSGGDPSTRSRSQRRRRQRERTIS